MHNESLKLAKLHQERRNDFFIDRAGSSPSFILHPLPFLSPFPSLISPFPPFPIPGWEKEGKAPYSSFPSFLFPSFSSLPPLPSSFSLSYISFFPFPLEVGP